jgi:predicted SprT family Zn-dependent metalloprotease
VVLLIFKGVKEATVKLKCPHCGTAQLRARKKDARATYGCRRCHKRFKAGDSGRR